MNYRDQEPHAECMLPVPDAGWTHPDTAHVECFKILYANMQVLLTYVMIFLRNSIMCRC